MVWIGLGGGAAVVCVYAISVYNGLVALRQNVEKAWANIDVLLKQRHDEIPKLIAVCEGYKDFERKTLDAVIKARSHTLSAMGEKQRVSSAAELSVAVKGLLAIAESYPDLKTSEQFLLLQKRVTILEENIADRREFYNESVTVFNTRIAQIPDMVFASLLSLTPRTLYQIDSQDRRDVVIRLAS